MFLFIVISYFLPLVIQYLTKLYKVFKSLIDNFSIIWKKLLQRICFFFFYLKINKSSLVINNSGMIQGHTTHICKMFSQYEAFKENVRSGKYGKTAQYWIQYMDRVWLLLQFVQATKTNNFSLHVSV